MSCSTYNTTSFKIVLENCKNAAAKGSFYALYVSALMGTVALGIRELLQAIFSWKQYYRSRENILEFLIVAGTAAYLIVMNFNIPISRHLAAWSVFFGWLELTMLIGRFPSIGIYIYMSVHVIKILLLFVLVSSNLAHLCGILFTLLSTIDIIAKC